MTDTPGWNPQKGGYTPTEGAEHPTPPQGGSGVVSPRLIVMKAADLAEWRDTIRKLFPEETDHA